MKNKKSQYFARSRQAMENGSFMRVDGDEFATYVNGDYISTRPIAQWPDLAVKDFIRFSQQEAESLLPRCCR